MITNMFMKNEDWLRRIQNVLPLFFLSRTPHLASQNHFTRDVRQLKKHMILQLPQPPRKTSWQNTYHWQLSYILRLWVFWFCRNIVPCTAKQRIAKTRTWILVKEHLRLNSPKKVNVVSREIVIFCKKWKINPSVPNAPFLYRLKRSENRTVFWCFQGGKERVHWERIG